MAGAQPDAAAGLAGAALGTLLGAIAGARRIALLAGAASLGGAGLAGLAKLGMLGVFPSPPTPEWGAMLPGRAMFERQGWTRPVASCCLIVAAGGALLAAAGLFARGMRVRP